MKKVEIQDRGFGRKVSNGPGFFYVTKHFCQVIKERVARPAADPQLFTIGFSFH